MSFGDAVLVFVIGAFTLHLVIRTAISGGMKDFERWKREQGSAANSSGESLTE
jgi:hypothetical protein